jgi:hypothetical protein
MTPENDKELEKLFSTAITEFDDNDEFIATLSDNLDKIGYAKRLFEAQEHRHKIGLLLAFIAGAVSVIFTMLIFPLLPTDAKIFDFLIQGSVMVMSGQSKMISVLIFAILSTTVFYSLLTTIRDIHGLKARV